MITWLGIYEQKIKEKYGGRGKEKYPEQYKQREAIRAYLQCEKERKRKERREKIKEFFKKIGSKN